MKVLVGAGVGAAVGLSGGYALTTATDGKFHAVHTMMGAGFPAMMGAALFMSAGEMSRNATLFGIGAGFGTLALGAIIGSLAGHAKLALE